MTKPLNASQLRKASAMAECLIGLRDKREQMEENHKKALAPWLEQERQVEAKAQAFLEEFGIESAKTDKGTIHLYSKTYASLGDADAFMDYILRTGEVDLMERRASPTACRDYAEEHGKLPPGVNLSVVRKVGVRKPS